ncbi:conserved Plasmodium protein, unknown function [Plasmodium gallinaceum]|uniref:Dynactin subunit 2 n=1 Tax=Plasmodium gallinaceum TaxID=5849 RepID=A0A1J1GSB0_PLAGA|nr:conserved Plasmodium protein, unknown function [Plasmodium gallinaceum]CRG95166.1 conserved Plasmodium protein, unknown function [Plasmodium gallinaceum]
MSSHSDDNKYVKHTIGTSENEKKNISWKSNEEKEENSELNVIKDNYKYIEGKDEHESYEKVKENGSYEENISNQENENILENSEELEQQNKEEHEKQKQEQNENKGVIYNLKKKENISYVKTNEKKNFSLKSLNSEKNLKYTNSSTHDNIDKNIMYNANLKGNVEGKNTLRKSYEEEDLNESKMDETFIKKSKKLIKDNLKPDTRDLFCTSQEKDVFEYVPDTSSYSICYNESNELYKDVVNMNKYFLDEINTNIYASPLNTYLSNMLNTSDNSEQKKKEFLDIDSKIMKKNTLDDEKKNTILNEECNDSKYSYEFFKNKIFKCYDNGVIVEVNPSKLKYNNSSKYEYNQNMSSYLEDPLSYLQKLKCEVEDITTYIKDIEKTKEEADTVYKNDKLNDEELKENEKIMKKILHNREVPEVLMELFSLKNDINNILNDDKLIKLFKTENVFEEKNYVGDTKDIKNLIDTLKYWKKDNLKNIDEQNKSKSDNSLYKEFDIYTVKNVKEKDVHVNDLLMLERKISDVEKVLGIDKMPMLPYDDLNHAILDLYNKLSLLDSNKLENVKKKVQNLQSEFLNLKKFKKDVLNMSKERGNYEESIDELFKILDVWKKTHHIIPNILTRLNQLKKIHDNAHSFASRLDDLEKQQIKLDDTLSLAEKNIKLINCKIDENVNLLQDTLKKFESKTSIKNKI